jgi:hypothetical protein
MDVLFLNYQRKERPPLRGERGGGRQSLAASVPLSLPEIIGGNSGCLQGKFVSEQEPLRLKRRLDE